MKNALLFSSLLTVLLCGASCVTTPPAPVLTVELFDSRAGARRGILPEYYMAAPEPPVEERAPSGESPAGASGAAAAPLGAAVTPTASQVQVPDAGFITPTKPRVKPPTAWVLPEAPSTTARPAASAPAATPAATSPAKSSPAASQAASQATANAAKTNTGTTSSGSGKKTASTVPAGSTAKPGGAATGTSGAATGVAAGAATTGASGTAGETAQQSAASASGGTAGQGSAGGSYGRLREIYAREGDELQVGLEGTGFLFLGFEDAVSKSQGMSFTSKENRNGKTWFTFKALKIGTYDLDFVKQDNANATSTKETVRVHVVSDQDFSAAVGQSQAEAGAITAGAGEAGDPEFAEKLAGLGSYEAAVAELLKGYREGNPALNDQIAGLYARMGRRDAAAKYYTKNLTPKNAYTRSAVLGLVRIALAQGDQQGFMSCLKQFLAQSGPDTEELLIQAARMEKEKSEIGVGLDMTAEYVRRFPEGTWRDEADFLMAQLLEADSRFRDIARAREIYATIVKDRPESAFAQASQERILYIDRHFFQVR